MLARNHSAPSLCCFLGLVALIVACGNVEQAPPLDQSHGGESALEPSDDPAMPSTCDEYCDSVMSACQDEHAVYASREVCLAMCSLFEPGDAAEPIGNTFACRAQHARLAERDPE